ncbi:DUF5937 family protein [Lactiplantibacillus plantarum]|uniref:DUF5937 family protein n=1 Tax=Lactiplantibacillus plantarum TaxID=1590 RepID=UPI001AAF0FA2|nr:DUF5937 family protein [Lactiplantibacillus plantarum]MBO2703377.1 hypothetical protein [Lactiplantibacillus plantarum]MDN7038536.1 hypothetical protein [Lactiplantibacillus plantarum]WVI00485.1 DUF5937 family protein [Lactiplantibacillus plantarum]
MAIELKFDQHILRNGRLLKQCAEFVYSPLNELLCSLHVLQNKSHHGMLISWELEARSKLDAVLFQEMNYFSPFYEFGVPTFLTPGLYQNVHDIDEELTILKTKLSGNSSRVFVKDFITERKNNLNSHHLIRKNGSGMLLVRAKTAY